MANDSELEVILRKLNDAALQLSSYSTSNSERKPFPSSAGSFSVPFTASKELQNAKQTVLDATMAIQRLVSSPADFQLQMTLNYQHAASVRWLCYFNLPNVVPLEGSISYHEAATLAKVPEDQLRRITRMAATAGVFCEPSLGSMAHTPVSAQMQRDPNYLDTFLFMTETNMPTAAKMVEMTEKYRGSDARNGTAFNIAMQTELPFFIYLAQNPTVAKRLASGMKQVGTSEESHLKHLVHGYDWTALGKAKVIDLGGSMGHVSMALANAFPELSFVVQDLPDVVKRAQAQPLPPAIASRISFQAHSFLLPQPESSKGAEVFLIRQCLNNWPCSDAVNVLKNVLPSLGDGSRILIMNIVVPMPESASIREESLARVRDLFMMQAMNGGERDMLQWKQMLLEVDPTLKIVKIEKPAGSILSIIEVMKP